jgi:hypothetical protein
MDQPIACSLTATEYRKRAAEIRELLRDALMSREPIPGGERLTFTAAVGIRERVEELVAAESECCPFLTFALRVQRERLVLDVTQPEPTGEEQ